MPRAFETGLAAWAEQAIRADFGEAAREHVLEESSEEGLDGKRDTPGITGAGVRVAESDAVLLEVLDAVVGEGDAIDVTREVEQGVLTRADLLHVHGPRLLPHCGIDLL